MWPQVRKNILKTDMNQTLVNIIVAASGAFLGALLVYLSRRRKASIDDKTRKRFLRGAYLLMEEDYDGAVEEFTRIAQTDSDKPDLYFVLGRLFRKKKSYERAIQIHQDLIMRASLEKNTRLKAQYELGVDYRESGALDKARRTFEEVARHSPQWGEVWRELSEIALVQGDWRQAIAHQKRLDDVRDSKSGRTLNHLYAMEAIRCLENSELKAAARVLRDAQSDGAAGAHLCLAFARLHAAEGKARDCLRALMEGIEMQPESAPFLLQEMAKMADIFEMHDELDRYLDRMLDEGRQPVSAFRLARAQRLLAAGNSDEAKRILSQLSELGLRSPDFLKTAAENGIVPPGGFDASSLLWQCSHCGQKQVEPVWHCPNCHRWETYFPNNRRT